MTDMTATSDGMDMYDLDKGSGRERNGTEQDRGLGKGQYGIGEIER